MKIPHQLAHIEVGNIIYHKSTLYQPYLVVEIQSNRFVIAYSTDMNITSDDLRIAFESNKLSCYTTYWNFLDCISDLAYNKIESRSNIDEYIL